MKIFYALLIATLFTVACNKKKDDAAKTDPAKTDPAKTDPAAKPTEAPKADPATPEPPKAEPAAAGAMTVDQAGTMAGALMDKIGAAVKSAAGDCARMGAALKPLTGEMKSMMEAGQAFDKDEAKKKEFETKYGDKMMKDMEGWMPAVEKCKDDPEVKAFFMAMG